MYRDQHQHQLKPSTRQGLSLLPNSSHRSVFSRHLKSTPHLASHEHKNAAGGRTKVKSWSEEFFKSREKYWSSIVPLEIFLISALDRLIALSKIQILSQDPIKRAFLFPFYTDRVQAKTSNVPVHRSRKSGTHSHIFTPHRFLRARFQKVPLAPPSAPRQQTHSALSSRFIHTASRLASIVISHIDCYSISAFLHRYCIIS